AIRKREFFVVYQPTFSLDDERITGAEALLRWNHPQRGSVLPGEFIPTLEATGMILEVGELVLERACSQAARWVRDGNPLTVSVNVSGRQLDRDDFVATVHDVLSSTGLEPRLLTLEITETTLMRNAELSARRLRSLKQLGVNVAVDDFGTGYCSLAYLQQFPVDALKIDQSFVSRMESSAEGAALVHTIVQMGRDLNIETVAEGIETVAQLERLRRERCSNGQGFLLAHPLEAGAFAELVAASRASSHLRQ
ncbi:MAG: putative bifunctional diguanylate cyclase/phosphodiesterase, partial [Acidimicrobiales bacterium]